MVKLEQDFLSPAALIPHCQAAVRNCTYPVTMHRIMDMKISARAAVIVVGVLVAGISAFPVAAQEQGAQLKLNITAKCEGSDALFEIVNEGQLWPAMAKISVYRTDNRTVIMTRQMRMTYGQKMAFKAKGLAEGKREFGLWIEPPWYERPFVFDAVIAFLINLMRFCTHIL
jgi:hypothetical protein